MKHESFNHQSPESGNKKKITEVQKEAVERGREQLTELFENGRKGAPRSFSAKDVIPALDPDIGPLLARQRADKAAIDLLKERGSRLVEEYKQKFPMLDPSEIIALNEEISKAETANIGASAYRRVKDAFHAGFEEAHKKIRSNLLMLADELLEEWVAVRPPNPGPENEASMHYENLKTAKTSEEAREHFVRFRKRMEEKIRTEGTKKLDNV